jgi:large subunit ribosomal protein L4
MSTIQITSPTGTSSGSMELPADIFDCQVNVPLMHQVVTAQLNAARQGSQKTKSHSEVSGGGKKPYKQKGTGNARQGSIRSPQWKGGGHVHSISPRDYSERTPKKMKAAALRSALSDRARENHVHILSSIVEGDKPSTKQGVLAVRNVAKSKKVLVIVSLNELVSWFSLRNVKELHVVSPGQLNTYDVLIADDVVFTKIAMEEFLAGPRTGKSASAVGRATDVEVAN